MKLHPPGRNYKIIKLLNTTLHHHANVRHTPVKSLETIRPLEITDTEHQTAPWFAYQMHTVNLNYITEKAGFCKHTHKFSEKSYVLNTNLCRVCESTHPKFLPLHPQNNYKYYA